MFIGYNDLQMWTRAEKYKLTGGGLETHLVSENDCCLFRDAKYTQIHSAVRPFETWWRIKITRGL